MGNRGAHRLLAVSAPLAALLVLPGCAWTESLFGRSGSTAPDLESADFTDVDTGGLAVYLEAMRRLIEGDSLTQAETFNDISDAAEFAPTTTNRLLYALVLSVPGHSGYDAEAAAGRLQDLIASGSTLLPEERMLAEIQLEFANQFLVLESARERMEAEAAGAEAGRNAEYEENLRRLRQENETLRAELEDARSMLDAITNIERSLSEREQTDE